MQKPCENNATGSLWGPGPASVSVQERDVSRLEGIFLGMRLISWPVPQFPHPEKECLTPGGGLPPMM